MRRSAGVLLAGAVLCAHGTLAFRPHIPITTGPLATQPLIQARGRAGSTLASLARVTMVGGVGSRGVTEGYLRQASMDTPEDKPLKLPDAVTFRQGSRASYRARVPSQRLDQIRKIFSTIDIDGSGCLDAVELQRAMAAMGVQKSMADIRLLIAEVDADQNGTVGVEEFVDMAVYLEKQKLREDCLEAHEATYSILWQEQAGVFRATGEYTIEARKRARRRVRGDDKTFASESAKLEFPSSAPGPLQTAYLSGKEVVINHGSGGYLEKMHSPKRRALAKEFGIKHIHFVPVKGGVMEYGRVDGQEVEVIRLLNSLTGEVLHPKSSRAFVATIVEMVGLLTFLVKMEENNILAGLAKAATALYDAVIRFEKSFERDILSAWTSTKDEAFQKKLQVERQAKNRASVFRFFITPVFKLLQSFAFAMQFLHKLWQRRNAPTDGVRQMSMRLASMSTQTLTRLGSVKSSSSMSPRRVSSNAGAGAGNNDVEIFVQNTK